MKPLVLIAAALTEIRPLARILEKQFEIAIALDGEKTLFATRQRKPDVILLDEKIRLADGGMVCTRMRDEIPESQEIPVLFLLDSGAHRSLAREQGAVDYLHKPFENEEVISRVQTFASLSQMQRAQKRYSDSLEVTVRERTRALEESRRETIYMLARAGEFNDTDTGVHIWRMSAYAQALAVAAKASQRECDLLQMAAPMHDIGKIGIPDSILKKPGKLNADEWQSMKTHTLIGRDILLESQDPLFQMGALIAHQHHERWDGQGYPQGIQGDAISVWARIVSVADVFDALTMKRPYKEEWPVEKAVEVMHKDSGSHFDPKMLELFRGILPEILRIKEAFVQR
ncbi:Cyclic di-GMP phosphodiesterase response regulator RpfG [Candidatus Magnetaquicoccaceae bacterium FCR-1]|uniref:Cyclic di-GMP phosphodiesterase response regulator RpfG n=1 Tax=Candidatus Magnetaquiglobus chichijimensis TaxID=3141448 RepID=A0ABQ0CAB7_9PROT